VRSERLLLEQLDYNLLFRWFVGLNTDDPVWDATVFSKNRERLLKGAVAQAFFEQILKLARQQDLLSDERFPVDGTLIEAWPGRRVFRRKTLRQGRRPRIRATRRWTSTGRSAATRPTSPRLIPRHGFARRDRARKPSSAIRDKC